MAKQTAFLLHWKAHLPFDITVNDLKRVQAYARNTRASIAVALPLHYLIQVKSGNLTPLQLGSNALVSINPGAFTETVGGLLLKDAGAQFVLIGSSIERKNENLTNDLIRAKIEEAFAAGMQPILCIGESWTEYESGQTEAVLQEQLKALADQTNIKIVYEAPWLFQSPHLIDLKDLQKAYETCRKLVPTSIPVYCAVPHELQDLNTLFSADGFYFSRGPHFLQFTPKEMPEESVEPEPSADEVATVVGDAILAAASEEEALDEEIKVAPKRPEKSKNE